MKRFFHVAQGVAWRSIHNTLVNPAILVPSIIFPLFFLIAFAGGLSRIADIPNFHYRPGYTAFQFVFVFLQSAAFGGVFTGFAIAIGITWEVVIAAEMASATNGLGYLTWNAYVNHSLPGIIIGMLSIGFAGMASSAIVVWLGRRAMPWQTRT